jgi:tetratricopeptide (TPR) repeat protein
VHVLILGGTRDDRERAARLRMAANHTVVLLDPAALPFTRVGDLALPPAPRSVLVRDLERAFSDNQAGGTRLVLTQSTYLLQTWIDRLDPQDQIVATADGTALERVAPEAFQRRGPWAQFQFEGLDHSARSINTKDTKDTKKKPEDHSSVPLVSFVVNTRASQLAAAFTVSDPVERLRLCRDTVEREPESAVAHLALASALRENRDLAARAALDRAAALAPDWEAVHYESGKLWLALDDMARAGDAFARAGSLMPTFSAAFSNLGATLGELDSPEEALAAFEQALAHDPQSFTILNNLGVVQRELGRLEASESAFRRVVALAPEFVFGHYNLGHTLFLAGDYAAALRAYEEGERRDPEKNRRQGCRLAIVRLAAGDLAGAERDLYRITDAAAADEREDLLLEAYEIALALTTSDPARAADATHRQFLERLGSQIVKSE